MRPLSLQILQTGTLRAAKQKKKKNTHPRLRLVGRGRDGIWILIKGQYQADKSNTSHRGKRSRDGATVTERQIKRRESTVYLISSRRSKQCERLWARLMWFLTLYVSIMTLLSSVGPLKISITHLRHDILTNPLQTVCVGVCYGYMQRLFCAVLRCICHAVCGNERPEAVSLNESSESPFPFTSPFESIPTSLTQKDLRPFFLRPSRPLADINNSALSHYFKY